MKHPAEQKKNLEIETEFLWLNSIQTKIIKLYEQELGNIDTHPSKTLHVESKEKLM